MERNRIKHKILLSFVLIIALFIVCTFSGCDFTIRWVEGGEPIISNTNSGNNNSNTGNNTNNNHNHDHNDGNPETQVIQYENLSFHFLELGNQYTGDCTYIKAGDVDILIDAGSRTSSLNTIKTYLDANVLDGKLEYVIVTHAHEDHYACFATSSTKSSLLDLYEVGTLIDFAQVTSEKTSQTMYQNYQREVSEAVARGTTHYTALECVTEQNGAKKQYEITPTITMTILNQRYYAEVSSDENNHSVCTLFTQGENNFLFTGDLEAEGESSLVALNTLPKCVLYKAGHHGSKTSSGNALLQAIQPQICCVCCCCGNVEYTQNMDNTFPTQDFVDRISQYTNRVYVTTLGPIAWDNERNKYVNDGFTSMNGNIVVSSVQLVVTVQCSNNNTLLKDTDWFRERRTMPAAWATT